MTKQKPKQPVIVPRGKWMYVRVEEPEGRVNDFGIATPDDVELEEKSQGTVVASAVEEVKVGDRIIFGMLAGEKVRIMENGKKVEYQLIKDEDAIAFIR